MFLERNSQPAISREPRYTLLISRLTPHPAPFLQCCSLYIFSDWFYVSYFNIVAAILTPSSVKPTPQIPDPSLFFSVPPCSSIVSLVPLSQVGSPGYQANLILKARLSGNVVIWLGRPFIVLIPTERGDNKTDDAG